MVTAVPEMQATGNQKQCFDMLVVRMMHIADMPSVPEIIKQQESASRVRDVKNIFADRMSKSAPTDAAQPATGCACVCTITSAAELATQLQASKEILLYSYYSSNIEVAEFQDGKIKYFDRKGDADFMPKLAKWLMDKTGKQWLMEKLSDAPHAHTISEQKQEELVADPLVASAMDLFADAEIVGVK